MWIENDRIFKGIWLGSSEAVFACIVIAIIFVSGNLIGETNLKCDVMLLSQKIEEKIKALSWSHLKVLKTRFWIKWQEIDQ